MMGNPTFKTMWLTMLLAGLTVLVEADNNASVAAFPKAEEAAVETMSMEMMTNKANDTKMMDQPAPPLAAVMDLFQAPLAAFKPKMLPQTGRADDNTSTTPRPNNIFFRAGSNLGSAASSLTGWFNNRMVPQAFRQSSTTTPAPQIIRIVANQQQNQRKPNQRRRRPVSEDLDDSDDNSADDVKEDDEQAAVNDENVEENADEVNIDLNQEEEQDDENLYELSPVGIRKVSKQTKKRPSQEYFYIEEDSDSEDDDSDYDVEIPVKKNQRKKQQQKQQNQPIKRRKNSKKQQNRRRKPNQKLQNNVQRPANSNGNRKRRPSASFELVPISPNQALNSIQMNQSPNQQNNNQQSSLTQFFSIPWSRLGLSGQQTTRRPQAQPIIIRVPPQQQNMKRKRRPSKKPTKMGNGNGGTANNENPKRKVVRGQSPVFAMLSEDQVSELFKRQGGLQPVKVTTNQMSNLPVTLTKNKKKKKNPVNKESEEKPQNNNNNDNNNNEDIDTVKKPQSVQSEQAGSVNDEQNADNTFIIVGPADDDKEFDQDLYRHVNGRSSSRYRNTWEDEYDDDAYDIYDDDDDEE